MDPREDPMAQAADALKAALEEFKHGRTEALTEDVRMVIDHLEQARDQAEIDVDPTIEMLGDVRNIKARLQDPVEAMLTKLLTRFDTMEEQRVIENKVIHERLDGMSLNVATLSNAVDDYVVVAGERFDRFDTNVDGLSRMVADNATTVNERLGSMCVSVDTLSKTVAENAATVNERLVSTDVAVDNLSKMMAGNATTINERLDRMDANVATVSNAVSENIASVNERLPGIETTVNALHKVVIENATTLHDMQSDVTALHKVIHENTTTLHGIQSHVPALHQVVGENTTTLHGIQSDVTTLGAKVDDNAAAIHGVETHISNFKNTIYAHSQGLLSLEIDVRTVRQKVDGTVEFINKRLEDFEKVLTSLNDVVHHNATTLFDDIKANMESFGNGMANTAATTSKRLDGIDNNLVIVSNQVEATEFRLKAVQEQQHTDDGNARLQGIEANFNALHTTIESMNSEIVSLNQRTAEHEITETTSVNDGLTRIKADIVALGEDVDQRLRGIETDMTTFRNNFDEKMQAIQTMNINTTDMKEALETVVRNTENISQIGHTTMGMVQNAKLGIEGLSVHSEALQTTMHDIKAAVNTAATKRMSFTNIEDILTGHTWTLTRIERTMTNMVEVTKGLPAMDETLNRVDDRVRNVKYGVSSLSADCTSARKYFELALQHIKDSVDNITENSNVNSSKLACLGRTLDRLAVDFSRLGTEVSEGSWFNKETAATTRKTLHEIDTRLFEILLEGIWPKTRVEALGGLNDSVSSLHRDVDSVSSAVAKVQLTVDGVMQDMNGLVKKLLPPSQCCPVHCG